MEQPEQPTQRSPFERSPFEIISECFSIYGRHFRKLLLIALIVNVAIGAVGFVILPNDEELQTLLQFGAVSEQSEDAPQLPPFDEIADLMLPISVYMLIASVLQTIMGGAIIYAVGTQYAAGAVDVGRSYGRAWWRVLTLVILGLLIFGLIVLMVAGFALLIVPGIVVLTLIIYWSVDVQAAMIEGRRPIASLQRSFGLVRGNWWRTFAAWALIMLVAIGLSLVIGLPLGALTAVVSPEDGITGRIIETLVNTIVGAIIAPLPAIAGALIYLDLRARKEDYDIDTLSQELGFAPRNGS